MEIRPNFYALLELNPSVHDWPTIELTIQNKRREWSLQKNQGTPAQKRKAERYLKFIPEMEIFLKDEQNCIEESKLFQNDQTTEKQNRLRQLDGLIQNIPSQIVSKELIKKLHQETGKVFTELEIEQRLRQRGIDFNGAQSNQVKKTERPKLETSVAKGIRDELDTLKLKSLYDFLNLTHSPKLNQRSSPKSLYERADAIYKELSRMGKIDADSTLKMGLAGRAKSVFIDDHEKQRYDNTLAFDLLQELNSHLEIAGIYGFLTLKQFETLFITGKKMGVADSIVEQYIKDYATNRKWDIQREAEFVKPRLYTCGICGVLAASPEAKRCQNCGDEFIQACPRCGALKATENAVCDQCGCHTPDASLVKSLLKEGQNLSVIGDYEKAIACFDRALVYWPDWHVATQEKQRIESKKNESHQALEAIKTLLLESKLEQAEAKLEQYQLNFGLLAVESYSEHIKEGLNRAKKAYQLAEIQRSSGNDDQAFDFYQQSLSYCVDYSPALSAMANNPPPAPTAITTKWLGDTLRCSWTEVKAPGQIGYKILRKIDGVPAHFKDGDCIALTSVAQFDDAKLNSGSVYYYAVFSVRSGCHSIGFATSGPHLLAADVSTVDYQAVNQQVAIHWQAPIGSIQVEVWRREKLPPTRRGEGQKMIVSDNSLLDTCLENDRTYGYLIVAKYPNPEDALRSIYSKGVTVLATPIVVPEPINDLRVRRSDQTFFLSWTEPKDKAQLQIRQMQNLPHITPGQIISIKNADLYGALIPINLKDQTQVSLNIQGRIFFVPLTVRSETAVLGKPVVVTTFDEASDFMSKCNSSSIILTWQWPKGATEALLAYHHDHFPVAVDEPGVINISVTLRDYQRNHYFELRNPMRKKHYFTLFIKDSVSGILSNGVYVLEAMGQELTLRYKVVVKKRVFSRTLIAAWVEFQSDLVDRIDESIWVVMQQKFPPVSKSQGSLIAIAEQLIFDNGIAKIQIGEEYLNKQGYIKVFFEDDSAAKNMRLLPFYIENLKLN